MYYHLYFVCFQPMCKSYLPALNNQGYSFSLMICSYCTLSCCLFYCFPQWSWLFWHQILRRRMPRNKQNHWRKFTGLRRLKRHPLLLYMNVKKLSYILMSIENLFFLLRYIKVSDRVGIEQQVLLLFVYPMQRFTFSVCSDDHYYWDRKLIKSKMLELSQQQVL